MTNKTWYPKEAMMARKANKISMKSGPKKDFA